MKMTRPAPQPACARVRQLVAVWLGTCLLWLSDGAVVCAQVGTELERALTVTREMPGCVSAPALRARTAQYLGRADRLAELSIEVDLQVPQFRVLRNGRLLAERRFARAPTDCSERRDALALALAIAIEQATSESRPSQPSAAVGDNADDVAGSRSTKSEVRAPQRTAADSIPDSSANSAPTAPPAALRATAAPVEKVAPAASRRTLEPQRVARERGSVPPRTADRRAKDEDHGEHGEPQQMAAREPGVPLQAAADAALTPTERPRAPVSLFGAGSVLFEALPTAAMAFSVGAELGLSPALRIGLSGLFSLPVSTPFQGGLVSTQLYGAQLTGCINAPLSMSLLLHGCAGAVGGIIEAQGERFALNLNDRMGWLAGLVRAKLEFPVAGRLSASLYADARVNLLRPELQASLPTEPARSRAVAVLGTALGVELIVRLH
jgi:hypothetical protein